MRIRGETPADAAAIRDLTTAAFAGAQHSSGTEAAIIEGLRTSAALTLSRVMVEDRIVGHIAFSPIRIDGRDHGWHGLGPVSVAPYRQGTGIGSALIRDGLAVLRSGGSRGCVVLGEPGFYRRFGFLADPALWLADVPPEYFLRLSFADPPPAGRVTYHPAFGST